MRWMPYFLSFFTAISMLPNATLMAQENTYISPLAGNSVLTKKQLDSLSLGQQKVAEVRSKNGNEIKKYKLGEQSWELSSSAKDLNLGIWMSKNQYKMGEPIHALILLKNTGASRGLDMWLTVSQHEYISWNSSRLHITQVNDFRDKGTKKQPVLFQHIWSCGKPLATIKDYVVIRGDLRCMNLSPGQYRLSWNYGSLCSNEVEFTIVKEKSILPNEKEIIGGHRHHTWINLHHNAKRDDTTISENGIANSKIKIVRCEYPIFEHMSRSLGMGRKGLWYPDIYDIPISDSLLSVTSKLKSKSDETSSIPMSIPMELSAKTGKLPADLQPDNLHFALIVVPTDGAKLISPIHSRHSRSGEDSIDRALQIRPPLSQLQLNVELPPNWANNLPFHGPGKMALLIGSEPFRDRTGWRGVEALPKALEFGPPRWQGILRTPWLDINVPVPRERKTDD